MRGRNNITFHTVHPGAVATNITLNADYHGSSTQKFHDQLQAGTSPQRAAQLILKGIRKNTGRIFISDGKVQDILARLLPNGYVWVVKQALKLKKVEIR